MSTKAYGIGAEFESAGALLEAAHKVREQGYMWWDTHSAVAIHGMDDAVGRGKSWVSGIALGIGLFGLVNALVLQIFTAIPRPDFLKGVLQGWYGDMFYPMMVSGKPYFDLAGNLPVNAVLAIQLTGYGAFVGFLIMTFLPRLYNPIFNWERFCQKVTNDGFFLTIEAADPKYSETETAKFLHELGGKNVTVIPAD